MNNNEDRTETNAQKELRILREYVHLLADATDKSPLAFAAGYPDGRTMAFNEAFARLTGYSEEELRGMQWILNLTPTAWQEKEANALDQLRSSGHYQTYEKEFEGKDGSRTPTEVLINQIRDKDGKVLYYYQLIKDLTDRKRADMLDKEAADLSDQIEKIKNEVFGLRAENGKLEKAISDFRERSSYLGGSAFEGLAIVQEGKIVETNDRYAELTGYTKSEIIGLPLSNLVTPGLRGLVSPQISGAAEGTFEVMLNRKDGERCPSRSSPGT